MPLSPTQNDDFGKFIYDAGQYIYDFVYDFQPLIAGVLALAAALITVRVLMKQINLTTWLTSDERWYQFSLSDYKDKKIFVLSLKQCCRKSAHFLKW